MRYIPSVRPLRGAMLGLAVAVLGFVSTARADGPKDYAKTGDVSGTLSSIGSDTLLNLMNFWGGFYLLAKYGMEAGNMATASELFRKEEADIAVLHVAECHDAASRLRYLPDADFRRLLT